MRMFNTLVIRIKVVIIEGCQHRYIDTLTENVTVNGRLNETDKASNPFRSLTEEIALSFS